MSVDMSILSLITEASLVVKVVMILLLLASLASWWLIFIKWGQLRKAKDEVDDFEEKFWSGTSLDKLYQGMTRSGGVRGSANIFVAGFKEYARLANSPGKAHLSRLDMVTRSMRVALSREVDNLERSLAFLATVGSTSPYVGLFGTVWGMMNSFRALGSNEQAATLSTVAPGIAEALIATAIGLFAAIPAVIAYNRFSDDVERLITSYDAFVEEFTTLLQRQFNSQTET